MITEKDLMDNFALVSADLSNGVSFKMNGERDDCTGFMSWLGIWNGVHFSYEAMKEDCSVLKNFKVVMLSGHPSYFEALIKIAQYLKGNAVTMFLPEGDVCQYDMYGIQSFNPIIYDAFKAVDVIASMEEDKLSYYMSIVDTPAVFVHVPIDERMAKGEFRTANRNKSEHILIYGDNNPNCPITVFGIARRLKRPLKTVCIADAVVNQIRDTFGIKIDYACWKMGQYPFLRLLGSCWLHIYPTRWIGSAREVISCAVSRTPCIGSNRSHTQRRLFPKLAADIYDIDRMMDLANRLYDDLEFYDEIVNYAWDNIQFYNLENTKKRFIEAYKLGKQKAGIE